MPQPWGSALVDHAASVRPGAACFASAASGECRPLSTARNCSQSSSGWAGTIASMEAVV